MFCAGLVRRLTSDEVRHPRHGERDPAVFWGPDQAFADQGLSLTRELLDVHGSLSGLARDSEHHRMLLREVAAMLRVLDDRLGARERWAQQADDRRHDERRSALRALHMCGPSTLSYRRVDAGEHLGEDGRAKTTPSNLVAPRSSVRTVSGGLPGQGKRT